MTWHEKKHCIASFAYNGLTGKVKCKCGYSYSLEPTDSYAIMAGKDKMLDAYNAHLQCMKQRGEL